jgi:hypothetical protein
MSSIKAYHAPCQGRSWIGKNGGELYIVYGVYLKKLVNGVLSEVTFLSLKHILQYIFPFTHHSPLITLNSRFSSLDRLHQASSASFKIFS